MFFRHFNISIFRPADSVLDLELRFRYFDISMFRYLFDTLSIFRYFDISVIFRYIFGTLSIVRYFNRIVHRRFVLGPVVTSSIFRISIFQQHCSPQIRSWTCSSPRRGRSRPSIGRRGRANARTSPSLTQRYRSRWSTRCPLPDGKRGWTEKQKTCESIMIP